MARVKGVKRLKDEPGFNGAIERLRSEKVDERGVALIELKRIINSNRENVDLVDAKDDSYHTVLESVFRVATIDKSNYARASKSTKTRVEGRLSACAALVRTVVEVGLRKLRYKTVKALVDHIIQTLPTADGGYCDPLIADYFRALATLLEYKAHPEHFLGDDWHEVTDFCLQAAVDLNRSSELHESGLTNGGKFVNGSRSNRDGHSRSATPRTVGDHSRKSTNNSSQRTADSRLKGSDDQIVLCLQHLASVPNAPVFDRADVVLATLVEMLQSYHKVSATQQAAFECINSIMSRIVAINVDLPLQTMKRVIPLLRRFWEPKEGAATLNDTLLAFLSYGEILLPRMISGDETSDSSATLQALVEVLRDDYCQRRPRGQLQLDDLVLIDPCRSTSSQMPLSIKTLQVRLDGLKAESPWCLLSRSAAIKVVLENATIARQGTLDGDELQDSKRQKLEHPMDDMLHHVKGSLLPEKLYALQMFVFIYDILPFDEGTLQCHLDALLPCLTESDGSIVSWTMLAMTSAANQAAARKTSLKEYWLRIWRTVARLVTSTSTCRAACQLMTSILAQTLIQYADVADVVDGMIKSVDLNGPAECDEPATTLWTILVALKGRENLGSASEASENVLRWLFHRWSPAKRRDRRNSLYMVQHFSTFSTLRLICICLGLPAPSVGYQPALNLGMLAQATLKTSRDRKLMKYLLLADDLLQCEDKNIPMSILETSDIRLAYSKFQILATSVINFFISEGSALLRNQFSSAAESASGMNVEVIRITTSFSIIGYALLSSSRLHDVRQGDQVKSILQELRTALKQCMLHHNEHRELLKGLFESFGAILGSVDQLALRKDILMDGAIAMSQDFDQKFWQETLHSDSSSAVDTEHDAMDLDSEFESQISTNRQKSTILDDTHYEVDASTNVTAFRACVAAKICFLSNMKEPEDPASSVASQAVSSTIDYLTSLQARNFLVCRVFLRELLDSGIRVAEDDATTLLEYLAQVIIHPYDLERSEVSMGVCLDVLTGLAEMWMNGEGSDLAEVGAQLYKWFITIALNKGISSPHIHICISDLLQKVIKIRPEYARSLSLASARTCLFEVLDQGNVAVKFYIGNKIADIFGLFVLKEHENILEDVIASLPTDRDWIEGIALRLYVLAHLAASWSTLLRRCVYAIFETPTAVPGSAGYAKNCMSHIATSLKLHNLRDLFKLFVSQILYTWLETQPLRSIPYAVFGYVTLDELLHDVQDEVVGHVVMRGKDDEAVQLADDLDVPFEKLLEMSFSRAAAYSIGRDFAMPTSMTTGTSKAETRLRNVLGKEQYSSFMSVHFAKILALFYTTMDPDAQVEKGFQKRPASKIAYFAYQKITSRVPENKVLPPGQQPTFKARYVFDEIECLCRRTTYDAESIWSPELYVYVFRDILNTIHPELGSLSACVVLRRIRIMICMAGTTALEGYPLEMTLQSLRPFLTDAQCSEDAVAIVHYLLESGAAYLKEVPSFLAGHAVSTLTAMKAFFESTQDSTTQESQFKATMSRAQAFHAHFVHILGRYSSPHLTEESAKCFKTIVRTSSNMQNGGNARLGTHESELLLELLEDQRSGRNLLDQSSQDAILKFLCTPFEVPLDFHDDILGSDELAVRYASVVWNTCQRPVSSPNYLLWAGRVLGRAYASKGLIDRELAFETKVEPESKSTSAQAVSPYSCSRSNLLRLLCDILTLDQSIEVGMAEKTLRSVVTATIDTDDYLDCVQFIPPSLIQSLLWRQYRLPMTGPHNTEGSNLQNSVKLDEHQEGSEWIQQLALALALSASDDPFLSELTQTIRCLKNLAEDAFPYILHLVLLREAGGLETTKRIMSQTCRHLFHKCISNETDKTLVYRTRILLKAILYLRTQPLPHETTEADRTQWLDLDYHQAAAVALKCSMNKTALLFVEIEFSAVAKSSRRRSSAIKIQEPTELLLDIYQNIDEQDAFYGVQQPSSLSSMMARLEYEHAGFKSLSFRGAHYDGQIRHLNGGDRIDEESMVKALDSLDLNGLSQSVLSKMSTTGPNAIDSVLRTARKLEQWDISAPASHSSSASRIFRAFQGINNAVDSENLQTSLNIGFTDSMNQLTMGEGAKSSIHTVLGSLAILTEADEVFSSKRSEQLYEALGRFKERESWMHSESYEHVKAIISCRETLFSSLSKKPKLQELLKTSQRDARSLESHLLLASSRMSRAHGAIQNALSTVTYLTELVKPCKEVGVDISAVVRLASANVLWDQGEMAASIRMLQDLQGALDSHAQMIEVSKPELLAKLGHQMSEARLEKPDEIITHYLRPAIKELRGKSEGNEAGEVFHEFASFCDKQLQNADGLEDFQRIQKLRERKEAEVGDLDKMIKSASSQAKERDNLKNHRAKAKQWFDIDDREFQRLRESRLTFLRQSLENYLLCLKACDNYDNDALRFSALWLENYESDIANEAVSRHVGQVGSRKFAALMNQWSSRLLEKPGQFQSLLSSLVLRICLDHPYHGMYQIFTGFKTKSKDDAAVKRHAAASNIVQELKASSKANSTWLALHNTNLLFVKFAIERPNDPRFKQGAKMALQEIAIGQRIEHELPKSRVPPPTMKIELRHDCDYRNVPVIAGFESHFSVASGISMPKIATAIGTDGVRYKQLFKGGSDDLRQDSIMEQVFDQVSNLLKSQRATRQRNLGIRTYKVLPLTATAGIIEFVANTIPLHDYLLPAHQRHFPKDLKPNNCRKHIADAQTKSVDTRIKVYRQVCDQFHPVLRYFFMERFENPDVWFEKRLAYTRSVAASSILGHVLGLGDRHGQNILLDKETGEVVHIDLGIAFEQGRVLHVPEVVPFRLTRDLVDGMGITRTEGVFRRCCEFTLDALRNESYSIMTILDVLRYDPLYQWSLSPLRLKKMQDAQTENPALPGGDGAGGKKDNEPGEADRALTVVAKKLSKSLSVTATVNELIQQATDERNLAVLFAGWAAYV